MRKDREYTRSSSAFNSALMLIPNAFNLFLAAACFVAPVALIGLAVYGAYTLLTLGTVLMVAAVCICLAYLLSGPTHSCTTSLAHVDRGPTW
jgi:hypothetical protein